MCLLGLAFLGVKSPLYINRGKAPLYINRGKAAGLSHGASSLLSI
jgi:hypothetical protein